MLRPIIFRLGLRYTSRRLFQSILFVLGVALGVAVVIAIDLANASAGRAFELSAESISGRATHQIIGGPTGLPSELYRDIRLELGLRDSAPVVSESVRAVGVPLPLRLLGIDPFAEPPFRTYLTDIEVLGEGDAFEALTRFISEPGSVIISQTLADSAGLSANDIITLRVGGQQEDLRIIGLLQPDDRLSRQALDDLILTDIATAQEVAGLQGRISRIDLILPEGADLSALRALLPESAVLVEAGGSGGALEQMTAAFEINLQALSLLAVVVGVFLIYNTVTFSVVQRRPVIGIMRSVGATRDQIFAFIVGEAFALGLIGTVLGLGLGIIFGRFTVGLVSQTISDLYFTVNVSGVAVTPDALIKGVLLGLVASLGAAIVPALDATRTPPVGTMRRSSFEQRTQRLLPYITLMAVLVTISGVLLLQIPTTSLIVSFGGLFGIVIGGALFTPALLYLGMRFSLPLIERIFGVVGRMAARAVTRSLSRTSVAVAALTIAVSVIVGVGVMIESFRGTVGDWLQNTLGADVYVSPPLLSSNQATTDVDPVVMELMASVEGVESVSSSRAVSVPSPDYPDMLPVNLLVTDFDISRGERRFVWNNAPQGDAQAALDAGLVMVSEPFAFRRDITPENNMIRLQTDEGVVEFEIFGVYYDYSTDQGAVYMDRDTYDRYFEDPFISSAAAFVAPDADPDAVLNRMESALAGYDLTVQSNRDLRAGVFDVFERTFTITVALRMLATLVAFIGILSALMSLQLENTREYGVMRATGMTPGQLWRFTLVQTGLMGTAAGALALPLGLALAVVLIAVINVRSFGWSMQLAPSGNEFLTAFAVAVVAALLAGLYPAWRLARLAPARALRSE